MTFFSGQECREQQQPDADDDQGDTDQFTLGDTFREDAAGYKLGENDLDEPERPHIGGGGQRKSDEPELRGERTHEACARRGAPEGEAFQQCGTVENGEPDEQDRALNAERPDQGGCGA